jgi:hypothetical protein
VKAIGAELQPDLRLLLPETYEILRSANLVVHDAISCVTVEGSRGLRGGFRADSDVDLSLLVRPDALGAAKNNDAFLREVVGTTLDHWCSASELDTAVVFDKIGCGLLCFEVRTFADLSCGRARPDCLGVFKVQKGFDGFVPDIGLDIEKLFPILPVWRQA